MEFDIKKCYIYIVVDIVSNLSQIYVWRWKVSTLNNIQKTKNDIVNIGLHFILKNVRPYAASCSEA